MTTSQIVALGGGGFSMEESPLLDEYVLSVARSDRPKICFLPTASGDSAEYITRFYRRFTTLPCLPSHLELFRRNVDDLQGFLAGQDIVFVGGGNTANLLAVWKVHGVDVALRRAYEAGTVLAGLSAGSVCWFEAGVTDSFGPELQPIRALGFLPGSHCPHYDGEAKRRPAYHRLIREGMLPGIAADDGAALHFVDQALHRVVTSRDGARAYLVTLGEGGVEEQTVEAEYLGASRAGAS